MAGKRRKIINLINTMLRSHSHSLIFVFILVSTYAERIICYQYTSKLAGKQKSCISCTSRLVAFMKRLLIQARNRDFSLTFGLRQLISTFFVKISLNYKYVNQLNISLINIKLFHSLIKKSKDRYSTLKNLANISFETI